MGGVRHIIFGALDTPKISSCQTIPEITPLLANLVGKMLRGAHHALANVIAAAAASVTTERARARVRRRFVLQGPYLIRNSHP